MLVSNMLNCHKTVRNIWKMKLVPNFHLFITIFPHHGSLLIFVAFVTTVMLRYTFNPIMVFQDYNHLQHKPYEIVSFCVLYSTDVLFVRILSSLFPLGQKSKCVFVRYATITKRFKVKNSFFMWIRFHKVRRGMWEVDQRKYSFLLWWIYSKKDTKLQYIFWYFSYSC